MWPTSIEVLAMAASLHAADPDSARLDAVLRGVVNGKDVPGAVARIERGDGTLLWQGAAGTMQADDAWFVASITKLFTAAIVLQLHAEGRLGLDDRIGLHLPAETVQGLHGSGAADRSAEITVRQLLSHTSGLPDYFEGKAPGGTSLATRLLRGDDDGWTPADALAIARSMRPRFEPGAKDKASYADTNYQLLGLLIERVEGRPFVEVLAARIIEPLGLRRTYLYRDPADARPRDIQGRGGPLRIPRAMASFGPDGGVVSTAPELARFLRAWFRGELFPARLLPELQQWNGIFFPFQAGAGLWRFHVPRWMSPFRASPVLLGHGGTSGAFAFYDPARDLVFVGTVNSATSAGRPYRLLLRLHAAATR